MQGRPTIRSHSAFNESADAETLHEAMKGFRYDMSGIISFLCGRSNAQRQQIAAAFKTICGKDLLNELKSELLGDFEDLILGLMERPAKYDARQLHEAVTRLRTWKSVLIEIMCSRTNTQIKELRQAYRQVYGKELENDLLGGISGCFKTLLASLCTGERNQSTNADPVKARQDAKALHEAGMLQLECFSAIIASQSNAQLHLLFEEYRKMAGEPIEKLIESGFSGDVCECLLAIVTCIQNRPAYFAKLLYNSLMGLGSHTDLIRILVTRSEVDLADVREEFERKYLKNLESAIKESCTRAYRDGLIALVRGNYLTQTSGF